MDGRTGEGLRHHNSVSSTALPRPATSCCSTRSCAWARRHGGGRGSRLPTKTTTKMTTTMTTWVRRSTACCGVDVSGSCARGGCWRRGWSRVRELEEDVGRSERVLRRRPPLPPTFTMAGLVFSYMAVLGARPAPSSPAGPCCAITLAKKQPPPPRRALLARFPYGI